MRRDALSGLGRRTREPSISWLMKMAIEQPDLISLAAGFTDSESLPVEETRALVDELLRAANTGRSALQYGTTAGDLRLRELTAARLQGLDGRATGERAGPAPDPDCVLVTHGSQQLLYMVTEALCDEGDIVLVEDPTYFVYLGILQSRALRARGIRLTDQGLDLQHLEQTLTQLQRAGQLARVKMLYLVSYHQNPTGLTTAFENKAAALRLLRRFERAAGHPIYLLEDAAYRELRFAGADVPSARKAPGGAARVIYAGTYSKPYATGVRVGFGLLPRALVAVVRRIKGNHDFGTVNFAQQLLARALASGVYERHLAVLRARYARKAETMVRSLKSHFPDRVGWAMPGGGLYVWVKLPARCHCGAGSRIFKDALAGGVLYVPGQLCYADDPRRRKPDCEMRLSFGHASIADIREGMARLGKVLRDSLGRSG